MSLFEKTISDTAKSFSSLYIDESVYECRDEISRITLDKLIDKVIYIENKEILCQNDFIHENAFYVIKYCHSLNSKSITIPENSVLYFIGGTLSKGTLRGNNTFIKGNTYHIFNEDLDIGGTWNINHISSNIFTSLSNDNSLRRLFGLTNSSIYNEVIIEKGEYTFDFTKNSEVGVGLNSNTKVILIGNVSLKANSFDHYYMFNVEGENIKIEGNGTISGDKLIHTGTDGEWGHCINVYRSKNVTIEGVTIKYAWGDGIYIGKESSNCIVRNCIIDNCRRQGISGVICNNLIVENCKISNISGTAPASAIDYEPNPNDIEYNFIVRNNDIEYCDKGVLCTAPNDGVTQAGNCLIENNNIKNCKRSIECDACHNVEIRNNRIINIDNLTTTYPWIDITGETYALIDHNHIEGNMIVVAIRVLKDVKNATISNNTIISKSKEEVAPIYAKSPINVYNNYIDTPVAINGLPNYSQVENNTFTGKVDINTEFSKISRNKFFGNGEFENQIVLYRFINSLFTDNIVEVHNEEEIKRLIFIVTMERSIVTNNILYGDKFHTGILSNSKDESLDNTIANNKISGIYSKKENT